MAKRDIYKERYGPLVQEDNQRQLKAPLPDDDNNHSRSESVAPFMPCEVCHEPDSGDVMLVCESCNLGFHIFCLFPRLHIIPDGPWYCGDCGGDSQRTLQKVDITEDSHVLQYLEYQEHAPECSEDEKKTVTKQELKHMTLMQTFS